LAGSRYKEGGKGCEAKKCSRMRGVEKNRKRKMEKGKGFIKESIKSKEISKAIEATSFYHKHTPLPVKL